MTLHDADTGLRAEEADPLPEPLRPPTPGGISMRPAMIVLGLAVLILVVFVTIGLLSSQSPVPVKVGRAPSAVPGTTLQAESAAGLLSPIVEAGRAADEHPQRGVRPGRVAYASRTRTTAATGPASSTRRWSSAPTTHRARCWRSSRRT